MRIHQTSSLLPEVQRGKVLKIVIDGKPGEAYEGETIASALLAAGIIGFRLTGKKKESRGIYCGMGICYECLVTVNDIHAVRACITPVEDGMRIDTSRELTL
jgi:sarcosine oxidase, subunit alpha